MWQLYDVPSWDLKQPLLRKYSSLGGTCLNVGCIPSKALLDSSEHFHNATHTFKTHGIDISVPKVNFKQMIARKSDVVNQNTDGIQYLMKKNKIDVFNGLGSFLDPHTVQIVGKETQSITGEKIIIATGSKPATLPFIKVDKKRVITSTEALELKEVPTHLRDYRWGRHRFGVRLCLCQTWGKSIGC